MSTKDSRWDAAILAAVERLEHSHGEWIGLVDFRRALGRGRAAVDEHLRRLSRRGIVCLVPESNRKALTQADHDAAIRIGGQDNHLLSWQGPR
ncbi:hypothetical protein ACFXPA_46525 [Amycolatopsis sp. NPDC059090]|uniref:hypothetical protein n=1 Tax=unclassified Amycolatopsis TaxID=2618356 RepID=UPI00366EF946